MVSDVASPRQNELVNGVQHAEQRNDGPDGTPGRAPGGRRGLRLVVRALVAGIVVASFAIWVYAFSGLADRDAPDLLDDPSFATSAEAVCAATAADLAELPNALDAVDGPDRADQLRRSTALLEQMIVDLDDLVAGSARDVQIADAWLDDWRVLLGDRYRYADAIEVDDNAQFLVTDTGVGERLDRRITRLANTNSMPSCIAPTDVG